MPIPYKNLQRYKQATREYLERVVTDHKEAKAPEEEERKPRELSKIDLNEKETTNTSNHENTIEIATLEKLAKFRANLYTKLLENIGTATIRKHKVGTSY